MGEEDQEIFTMVTQEGLLLPRCSSQGVLNAAPHFQYMVGTEVLEGREGVIFKMSMDGVVTTGRIMLELLSILTTSARRLLERRFSAAAHKFNCLVRL